MALNRPQKIRIGRGNMPTKREQPRDPGPAGMDGAELIPGSAWPTRRRPGSLSFQHKEVCTMGEIIRPQGPLYQQYAPYQRTREMSIEDMLLDNRIIFLAGDITESTASVIVMRLLYLQSIKKDQDVNVYINSHGGLVDQTLAIYDTMQFMGCDIATYCVGQAASGAALILMAGTKGKRFILPNSKVMLHQPYGGIWGQAEDMRIQAEEILNNKKRLNEIVAEHTGQPYDKVCAETERDRFMNADEAKEYGVVDEVLREVPANKKKAKDAK